MTPEQQQELIHQLKGSFRHRFPQIFAVHSVSCKTREGIPELVEEICRHAGKQPAMGIQIPKLYHKLEEVGSTTFQTRRGSTSDSMEGGGCNLEQHGSGE